MGGMHGFAYVQLYQLRQNSFQDGCANLYSHRQLLTFFFFFKYVIHSNVLKMLFLNFQMSKEQKGNTMESLPSPKPHIPFPEAIGMTGFWR